MAKVFYPAPINALEPYDTNKVFNVSIDGVIPRGANALNKLLPFNIPVFDINDLPVGISVFGLPVLDNIQFLAGKYQVRTGDNTISYNGLIIDTIVFQANQTKNIIKTAVQGRDRTVKEYISGGDINITMEGEIVNNSTNYYPTRDITNFISLMKVPQAIKVRSKFLDLMGINYIVIEDWDLPQQRGRRNAQPFIINAVADEAPETNELTGMT